MQTAQLMGLDVTLVLAAQSAGGAVGSIFAPAKIIVGCSTVGLAGKVQDAESIVVDERFGGALYLQKGLCPGPFDDLAHLPLERRKEGQCKGLGLYLEMISGLRHTFFLCQQS